MAFAEEVPRRSRLFVAPPALTASVVAGAAREKAGEARAPRRSSGMFGSSSKTPGSAKIFGIFGGRWPSRSSRDTRNPGGIFGTFAEARKSAGIFGIFAAVAFGMRESSEPSALRTFGDVRIFGIFVRLTATETISNGKPERSCPPAKNIPGSSGSSYLRDLRTLGTFRPTRGATGSSGPSHFGIFGIIVIFGIFESGQRWDRRVFGIFAFWGSSGTS